MYPTQKWVFYPIVYVFGVNNQGSCLSFANWDVRLIIPVIFIGKAVRFIEGTFDYEVTYLDACLMHYGQGM
jgi:hypothetical protein